MTLLVDQNEPASISLLLAQSVPTERMLLNRPANPPRPDYCFYAADGRQVGISRKQGGEFLGGVDAAEAQLLEEMAGVDYMALLIEGWVSPAPDGSAYDWRRTGATIAHRNHHYAQNWKGVRAKLARLQDLGVMIIQTCSEEDTAITLAALYECMRKPESEHRTFSRLIRERHMLSEVNLRKREMALILMGIPGVGEDVALALCDDFTSFAQLWSWLSGGVSEQKYVAALPLRSGKRSIGPAAVQKMRRALGL